MNLDAWLSHIEAMHPAEIELGLTRTREVAARLGVLELPGKVITIAGTNGKGSTATLTERLARAAGCRTALYTSPHIRHFGERVRLDGRPVDDDVLCQAFRRVKDARQGVPLTWFEFTTLAALLVFREASPDLVILEVGLGGRLDAVNVIDADVAVVTSVGLDHTDWLGDSRELIALEKAGIRRPGRPLVWGEPDPTAEVQALCQREGVPLLRAEVDFGVDGNALYWSVGTEQRRARLTGDVPLGPDNLAAACQALACVRALPAPPAIVDIARFTTFPGRCQSIRLNGVDWVFDVGHNVEALTRFRSRLKPHHGRQWALVGMQADKPARNALAGFVPQVNHWFLAGLDGSRARPASALRSELPPEVEVSEFLSPDLAAQALRDTATPGDRVLVFGSFLTVDGASRGLGIELEQRSG